MKPSKNKRSQPKKGFKDNGATPTIDNYFKAAAKFLDVEVEEKNVSDETDLKAIYIEALKTKLQGKHFSIRIC